MNLKYMITNYANKTCETGNDICSVDYKFAQRRKKKTFKMYIQAFSRTCDKLS